MLVAKLTTIIIVLLSFILHGFSARAAISASSKSMPPVVDPTKAQTHPKLEFIKNFKGKNQIKLLNNRFRVDYEIDELMLLFFRRHGSAPIVLVQPDGSKLYPRDADGETLDWHADVSYDLIRIVKPMAGPWQAVGKILSDSKVLVLTDIELQADTLPKEIIQYEVFKSKARVVNADEMINVPGFRDVIRLKANLYSTNDSNQANFGADIFRLGEFLDDGRNLDEKPKDGIFTLQYYVEAATGIWLPKLRVEAKLFTRELEQPPITVLPNPISFTARVAGPDERYHYVDIEVDDTYIDADRLIFQGNILLPNGESQTYNLAEVDKRELQIFQNDFGRYQIETQVFGFDKAGRDITLNIPPFEFVTAEPEVELLESADAGVDLEQALMDQMTPMEEEQEEDIPVALIIIINLVVFIFGFLVIWLFILDRDIPNPMKLLKRKKKVEAEEVVTEQKEEKVTKKAPESPSSDDILDLSLPED